MSKINQVFAPKIIYDPNFSAWLVNICNEKKRQMEMEQPGKLEEEQPGKLEDEEPGKLEEEPGWI